MTMPITIQTNVPVYNIEIVQGIVDKTTNEIILAMFKALVEAHKENNNFTQLAEKHTIKDLAEKITKSDGKVQRVYGKLFKATLEYVQKDKNNSPIVQTLAAIGVVTRRETASGEYLGSFVFQATEPMITKLQAEQPGAVDDARIWE